MAWWSRCKVLARHYTLLLFGTLALAFHLHQQLENARASLAAVHVEALEAGKVVSEVASSLRSKGEGEAAQRLSGAAVQLGVNAEEEVGKAAVCPEKYLGNKFWPYQFEAWTMEECDYGLSLSQLVTVVVQGHSQGQVTRMVKSLHEAYPGVAAIVETDLNLSQVDLGKGVEIVASTELSIIASRVDTDFVLLAGDLDWGGGWMNLERAIRLLTQGGLEVLGVGGGVRNSTGHWTIPCYQIELAYYMLSLEPGYKSQWQDCMICSYVGGPLLIRKESLTTLQTRLPQQLTTLELALTYNLPSLACPDIMFDTLATTGKEVASLPSEAWLPVASLYQFQGVATASSITPAAHSFTCDQVGLNCDVRSQSASFLLPWCCFASVRHILTHLEQAATQLDIDYQVESGSCLGAVKLSNFIPWDIDIDIEFATDDFHHFKEGGEAKRMLEEAGISLYKYSNDMYNVKGAGSFLMFYGGVEVEMLGSLTPLSRFQLPPHLTNQPTRAEIGPGLWVPVVSNPGLYIRGRYGPGYLYHSQSWRYKEGMSGSYAQYKPGGWSACSKPGHHACLNNYPIQGNMRLLSAVYPPTA